MFYWIGLGRVSGGESVRKDFSKVIPLLELDHHARDRDCPTAQTDALDTLVLAQDTRRDRPLVPNLAPGQIHLADAAAATPASDAVSHPGAGERGEHRLARMRSNLYAIWQYDHVDHHSGPVQAEVHEAPGDALSKRDRGPVVDLAGCSAVSSRSSQQ